MNFQADDGIEVRESLVKWSGKGPGQLGGSSKFSCYYVQPEWCTKLSVENKPGWPMIVLVVMATIVNEFLVILKP